MTSKQNRSFISSLIDTVASVAAEEATERLPLTGRAKATARRRIRREVRDKFRDIAEQVIGAKKTKKVPASVPSSTPDDPGVLHVQFVTACNTLGLTGRKFGERVNEDDIRTAKRNLAKKFHPDVAQGKNEQYLAVMRAAEWLEKYNEGVKK